MSTHADSKPWTVPALADAKREGRRLVMLTAYDNSFARVLDANGVDLVLIGDPLGMVVQGHDSTLPVTVDDIVCPPRAGARGLRRALLVSGMAKGIDGEALKGALRAGGFTAAVLGGIGSIPGAMVGGIVIGLCECFVSAIGLSAWKDAVTFAILIIVLLFKPTGFLGRKVQEKV